MFSTTQLFVFFLSVTALLISARRASWCPRMNYPVLLLTFSGLTACTGYFAWRDYASIRELKHLIDLPPYDSTIYVPRTSEVRTIARLLPSRLPPNYPLSAGESTALKNDLAKAKDYDPTWILKTSHTPAFVRDFYQDEKRRKGWTITVDTPVGLILKNQKSVLTIFFTEDFPRPGTSIVYVLSDESQPSH